MEPLGASQWTSVKHDLARSQMLASPSLERRTSSFIHSFTHSLSLFSLHHARTMWATTSSYCVRWTPATLTVKKPAVPGAFSSTFFRDSGQVLRESISPSLVSTAPPGFCRAIVQHTPKVDVGVHFAPSMF